MICGKWAARTFSEIRGFWPLEGDDEVEICAEHCQQLMLLAERERAGEISLSQCMAEQLKICPELREYIASRVLEREKP